MTTAAAETITLPDGIFIGGLDISPPMVPRGVLDGAGGRDDGIPGAISRGCSETADGRGISAGERGVAGALRFGKAGGEDANRSPTGLPQAPQNFLSGDTSRPHVGQRDETAIAETEAGALVFRLLPHLPQNFFPSATSEWQLGQIMRHRR